MRQIGWRGQWRTQEDSLLTTTLSIRISFFNFNTPLTPMDRSSRQTISMETQALKDTLNQMDLIHIYSTFHPKTVDFTFFSNSHRTFSRIDHILGHKLSRGKFFKKLML